MPHKSKRTYPSLGGKKGVLAAILRANRRSGLPLRYYFCKECKGYHMTKEARR